LRSFAAKNSQTVEVTVKNKYFFARVRVELSQLTWEPRQSHSVAKSVVIRPHDGVRNRIDHFAIRRGNLQRRSVINTPGDNV